MKRLVKTAFIALICNFIVNDAMAAPKRDYELRRTDKEFFTTPEAARIGEQVLAYQRVTGGWPKNIDMCRPHTPEELAEIKTQRDRRNDSTTDNNATTTQMTFLARLYQATGDTRYRDAFLAGMEYLLSGQYPNGGWPQFWPDPQGYQIHITFNDGAMANTLTLLRDIFEQHEPYGGNLTDETLRTRLRVAFEKGIDCILATQIRVDGKPTVWCQQHDRETFAPAPARSYELPSFCSAESSQIVGLLMQLPAPDKRIKEAVHGAMAWFEANKLMGYRLERTGRPKSPESDTRLVADLPALCGDASTTLRNAKSMSATATAFPANLSKKSATSVATATAGITTIRSRSITFTTSGPTSMTPTEKSESTCRLSTRPKLAGKSAADCRFIHSPGSSFCLKS